MDRIVGIGKYQWSHVVNRFDEVNEMETIVELRLKLPHWILGIKVNTAESAIHEPVLARNNDGEPTSRCWY